MKIMVISKKTLIWAATVLLVIVAAIVFAVFSGRDSGICDGICKRCTVPGDGGFLRVKIVELYRWRLGRLQFHCL